MIDQPNNSITFGKEIIRLDREGFHYRDQFIADAGEAHRLMVEFLRQQTQPKPQGPTDEELESTARAAELFSMKKQGGLTSLTPEGIHAQLQEQRLAGLRAVHARWGRPAIEPQQEADRG